MYIQQSSWKKKLFYVLLIDQSTVFSGERIVLGTSKSLGTIHSSVPCLVLSHVFKVCKIRVFPGYANGCDQRHGSTASNYIRNINMANTVLGQ